jgi:hypothetical protein
VVEEHSEDAVAEAKIILKIILNSLRPSDYFMCHQVML